jgi:hypothetical protein
MTDLQTGPNVARALLPALLGFLREFVVARFREVV